MSSSILTKNNDKFFIEDVDVKSIIKKFPTKLHGTGIPEIKTICLMINIRK